MFLHPQTLNPFPPWPHTPQAGAVAKTIRGMPALVHMMEALKKKHDQQQSLTLKDLDTIMPFKALLPDSDRQFLTKMARTCISDLGRTSTARGTRLNVKTADQASSSSSKAEKKASVLSFFG